MALTTARVSSSVISFFSGADRDLLAWNWMRLTIVLLRLHRGSWLVLDIHVDESFLSTNHIVNIPKFRLPSAGAKVKRHT